MQFHTVMIMFGGLGLHIAHLLSLQKWIMILSRSIFIILHVKNYKNTHVYKGPAPLQFHSTEEDFGPSKIILEQMS